MNLCTCVAVGQRNKKANLAMKFTARFAFSILIDCGFT
jgi:hypothetical protein